MREVLPVLIEEKIKSLGEWMPRFNSGTHRRNLGLAALVSSAPLVVPALHDSLARVGIVHANAIQSEECEDYPDGSYIFLGGDIDDPESYIPVESCDLTPAEDQLFPTPEPTVIPQATPTPTPTSTPRPIETPRPTETPNTLSWPPEMRQMLASLPLPEGIRLVRSSTPPHPRCATACYNPSTGEIWFIRGAPVGELVAIPHEVCHANQYFHILRSGLGPADSEFQLWLQTPQGRAFLQAYSEFESEVRSRGERIPWRDFGPIENFAFVCAGWYLPGPGLPNTADWTSLRRFSETWLPK